jgi:hypothetical protein
MTSQKRKETQMNDSILSRKTCNNKINLEEYDHYIALDWSQVNIALARSTRKKSKPMVIEWDKSDVKLVKEYLTKLKGTIILEFPQKVIVFIKHKLIDFCMRANI